MLLLVSLQRRRPRERERERERERSLSRFWLQFGFVKIVSVGTGFVLKIKRARPGIIIIIIFLDENGWSCFAQIVTTTTTTTTRRLALKFQFESLENSLSRSISVITEIFLFISRLILICYTNTRYIMTVLKTRKCKTWYQCSEQGFEPSAGSFWSLTDFLQFVCFGLSCIAT